MRIWWQQRERKKKKFIHDTNFVCEFSLFFPLSSSLRKLCVMWQSHCCREWKWKLKLLNDWNHNDEIKFSYNCSYCTNSLLIVITFFSFLAMAPFQFIAKEKKILYRSSRKSFNATEMDGDEEAKRRYELGIFFLLDYWRSTL